ncbi:MAG: two component, sigma54 specific, transcriptional regulator, Fis family [Acidobacteria bacterium]|nr:two component, sigma54 specific, transcriptional regulator, Fis family [Acidobacteriota bacterium]
MAIVDDDSAFSNYLQTFLSLRGYEARTYSRGDELLAAIRQADPPDIVLLDVMMPGLDGLATLRALKNARPETQAIMLSGREQASTIVEAVRLGAADYVVKPDDPEGLGEIALDVAIKNALEKNRLVSELTELRQQLSDDQDRAFLFWGNSEHMRRIANVIEHVADSDVTVLIRGESGVGKELVARAIHQRSPRRNKPLVKVNCAALPTELLESELFGHEKGAFTGAANTRIGKFEQADGGTLMLDEIAEMKAALQAKLLHVLQDGEFTRLGGNKRQTVDVRVLAATNRDLEAMMVAGDFREDLYYRLKVIEVTVPALRERRDEIPHLTDFFTAKYSRKYKRPAPVLSGEIRQLFLEHEWPGNIRELENMIKRLIILQDEQLLVRELRAAAARTPAFAPAMAVPVGAGGPLAAAYQPPLPAEPAPLQPAAPEDQDGRPAAELPPPPPEEPRTLADIARAAALKAERAALEQALDEVRWNRRKAAQLLGVSYKTLLNKIKECGISQR